MKDLDELSGHEKKVLLACGEATKLSLSARQPLGYIRKKLIKTQHKYLKKAMKTLISNGFIIEKPSRRNTTYSLSLDGLKACNILKGELKKGI